MRACLMRACFGHHFECISVSRPFPVSSAVHRIFYIEVSIIDSLRPKGPKLIPPQSTVLLRFDSSEMTHSLARGVEMWRSRHRNSKQSLPQVGIQHADKRRPAFQPCFDRGVRLGAVRLTPRVMVLYPNLLRTEFEGRNNAA